VFDLAVIGSGPGGYVAALAAAKKGMRVALIEKHSHLGGTCLNVGCIPSKTLLYASHRYEEMNEGASEFGIECDGARYDFEKMMNKKGEVVETLGKGVSFLMKKNEVTVLQGTASFIDPHHLQVGSETVEAETILIATGSTSIELPILPFDEERILSSTGALALSKVPEKLAVVGGGVIGLELASVYQRLGSEVVIVEMLDRLLPTMDSDLSKSFTKILKGKGFDIRTSTLVERSEKSGDQVELFLKGEKEPLSASHVLVSVGRRAQTKGLNLEKTKVQLTSTGHIEIDSHFQTAEKHIYAIGDVVDGPALAHKASDEALAVVEALAGGRARVNYTAIPTVVYTYPEIASVGLSEEEAKEAGFQLIKGVAQLRGNSRARCQGEVEGFAKVIGDHVTGRLLGVHLLASHAGEMIGEGVLAMEEGMSVKELAMASHAHPTLSEVIKEAALAAIGEPLHS